MKLSFSVLVLLLALASCYASSNNAAWGYLGYNNSTVLFNDNIVKESKVLQMVETEIKYPPKGVINYRPITAIRAWDQNTKGNGAKATIIQGGINNTSVTVKFVSKRGHSIKFLLEIFTDRR